MKPRHLGAIIRAARTGPAKQRPGEGSFGLFARLVATRDASGAQLRQFACGGVP
jgi:hypothetical protein